MKFIHIADIHLGAEPDSGRQWSDKRKQDIWDAFAEVIEIAEDEKVDFLFIAGDLFQRQPLLKELKEVNYLFGRLSRTKIVFIAGNHDYVHPNSYYRTFSWNENVFFMGKEKLQKITFPKEELCVYGLSYWHREQSEGLYDELPELEEDMLNVLLVHGGDAKHIPFSPNAIAEHGFDYTACGHIHKGGVLVENKVIMAGALTPIDSNDTGAHGYWMGELTKNGASAKFYPMQKCEYIHLTVAVNTEMTNRRLKDKIEEIMSYSEEYQLYKFFLSGRKSPEFEPDLETLKKIDHVVDVIDQLVPDYDFEKLKEIYDQQIIGRFIQTIEKSQDPEAQKALYYGIDALCRTMR